MNTITFTKQKEVAIKATQGQAIFERLNSEVIANPTKTTIELVSGDAPVAFDTVFKAFTVKEGETPLELPIAGVTSLEVDTTDVEMAENTSVIYEVNYELAGQFEGEIKLVVKFEDTTDVSELAKSETAVKVVTLEEAIRDYEDKLQEIESADLETIKSQYAQLEALRVVVMSAINALEESAAKTGFLTRYKAAASNQFTAYKLLLGYESKEKYLKVVSVKNVGGSRPYLFETLEHASLISATKAILFHPEDSNADILNTPHDFMSHLTDERKITFANLPQGESVLFVELEGVIKKLYITADETGMVTKFNEQAISIPEQGNTYNTPDHQAMIDLKDQITLATTVDNKIIDKTEKSTLTIDASFATVENIPANYVRNYALKSDILKTGTILTVFKEVTVVGEDEETTTEMQQVKQITLDKDETQVLLIDSVNLSGTIGAEKYAVEITNIKYVGKANLTVDVVAGEPEYVTKQYTLKTGIAELTVIDRQAALDHAIENTTVTCTGDAIQTTEETIELAVTTVFPEFLPALDPELKLDTLITLTKALPVGSKVELKADETVLGTFTAESETTKLWFTEIIGESSIRDVLTSKSDSTTVYTLVFSNLKSSDYGLKVQVITAKDGMFGTDAQHTMAYVDINMEVTDKSELNALIASAEELLGKVEAGDGAGQAPESAITAFTQAINVAKAIQADGDATLSQIVNGITALQEAIDTFKSFIVQIKVDKSVLLQKITDATSLIENVQVGTDIGNIPSQDYIDTLTAARAAAQKVYDETPNEIDPTVENDTTQAIVDAAANTLGEAITVFNAAIITDVQFVEAKLSAYETSAQAFLEGIRKKINI